MSNMELITRQEPGLVEFHNFEDLKTILEAELVRYQNIAYREEDLKEAKADQKKLKDLKKAIDEKRKEIKKIYMQPYEIVELQTKELIALIDEPLKAIAAYLDSAKEAEKAQKLHILHRILGPRQESGQMPDLKSPSVENGFLKSAQHVIMTMGSAFVSC